MALHEMGKARGMESQVDEAVKSMESNVVAASTAMPVAWPLSILMAK